MSAIIFLILGLAAVFGFLLGVYFFVFRLKLSESWQWVGGIVGGLVTGSLMVMAVMFILWPPFSFLLTGGVLIGAAVLTGLLMFSKTKTANNSATKGVLGIGGAGYNRNGGNLNENMDVYGLDLDVGAGS